MDGRGLELLVLAGVGVAAVGVCSEGDVSGMGSFADRVGSRPAVPGREVVRADGAVGGGEPGAMEGAPETDILSVF